MINDVGGQIYLPVQICVDHLHRRQKEVLNQKRDAIYNTDRSIFFMSVHMHAREKRSYEL